MPGWMDKLNRDPVPWLLEHDASQPAVRYFTLRHILDRDENDPDVQATKAMIMANGPVPVILANQHYDGYWGTQPRYSGTLPAIVFLAQLGADGNDPRIHAACEFLLSRYLDGNGCLLGGLSLKNTPSFNYCNTGNVVAALLDFGRINDPRLQRAIDFLTQAITETSASFICSANGDLPCAWGAIKAMIALSKISPAQRTTSILKAIDTGVNLLLSRDPAVADYPFGRGSKPSPNWFKFRYPLGTTADMLQNLEALTALGQAQNPRLANALDMVIRKQNHRGRWLLEHSYQELPETPEGKALYVYQHALRLHITHKEYLDLQPEKKGQASKWITLRALRVLKAAFPETD